MNSSVSVSDLNNSSANISVVNSRSKNIKKIMISNQRNVYIGLTKCFGGSVHINLALV